MKLQAALVGLIIGFSATTASAQHNESYQLVYPHGDQSLKVAQTLEYHGYDTKLDSLSRDGKIDSRDTLFLNEKIEDYVGDTEYAVRWGIEGTPRLVTRDAEEQIFKYVEARLDSDQAFYDVGRIVEYATENHTLTGKEVIQYLYRQQ